ncbi:MAG: phytanoyl-CoA dioxygenase family protein [Anaerolineae bacterium]|nr:phytanoyl-CoA dioxygenase family protein [Thermoflexales bacterium]MDW8408544.1 phytanoyl-CoA dioxygenase family protein [Anaerolineae bacterium]
MEAATVITPTNGQIKEGWVDTTDRIEVPKMLNDEQVRFFVDQGYLVVEDLVTPEELEELKRDTAFIARGGYPNPTLKPLPAEMSDAQVLRNILCIHQPHYISPVMLKYVKHPKICGVLSQITAAHLPYWDGSVKCMQSMLFVKPPQFQGQAWHQDEIYIPTRDRSLIGAWIAIDDATVENGCLFIIPGSHRSGYLFPQRPHNNPDEFDFAPESYGFDDSQEIPVEVKAGTVVFFNGYLLHRSRKNRSQGYRRVLVNHYMNAWSLLPWSLKEGERPANADVRKVVPVAGIDPYRWKGYEPVDRDVWLRTCKANEDGRTFDEDERPADD